MKAVCPRYMDVSKCICVWASGVMYLHTCNIVWCWRLCGYLSWVRIGMFLYVWVVGMSVGLWSGKFMLYI